MHNRMFAVALGLTLAVTLPARAEIFKGTMFIRGCDMS